MEGPRVANMYMSAVIYFPQLRIPLFKHSSRMEHDIDAHISNLSPRANERLMTLITPN